MTAPTPDTDTHRAADLARSVGEAPTHASSDNGTEDAAEVRAISATSASCQEALLPCVRTSRITRTRPLFEPDPTARAGREQPVSGR